MPDTEIEVAPPKAGEVWEHWKGGRYVIVGIAEMQTDRRDQDHSRVVLYRPVNATEEFYVRPLVEWHNRYRLSHWHSQVVAEWRFRKLPHDQQPCSCMDARHLTQGGYWDPNCLQHGVGSPGHVAAMLRMEQEKAEREDQPSQDLWGGVDG